MIAAVSSRPTLFLAILATGAGLIVLLIIVIASLWHKLITPLIKTLNRNKGLASIQFPAIG